MSDAPPHSLVVGASSGIGRAVAERLAPFGAVTAVARRLERLQELERLGVHCVQGDVAEVETLTAIVEGAVAENGKISSLIYCAGLQMIKPLRLSKPADIASMLKVNLEAPLVLAGMFTSRRVATEDAVFCAVSSIAAERPEPGIVAYSAAKAGLEGLIKGLAREAAPRRAVAVAPGWLDTEMTRGHANIYNEEFRDNLAKSAPLGIATVEAVVNAITFLISPSARFITGEIVTVDGGAAL